MKHQIWSCDSLPNIQYKYRVGLNLPLLFIFRTEICVTNSSAGVTFWDSD